MNSIIHDQWHTTFGNHNNILASQRYLYIIILIIDNNLYNIKTAAEPIIIIRLGDADATSVEGQWGNIILKIKTKNILSFCLRIIIIIFY